jgi:hypothetical protein
LRASRLIVQEMRAALETIEAAPILHDGGAPASRMPQRYVSVTSASGCETMVENQTALKNSDQNVSQ